MDTSEFFLEERPPPHISSLEISTQRKLLEILRILNEKSDSVIGARVLAEELRQRGFYVSERTVRYYLKLLDKMGLTEKKGYSGRVITAEGLKELEEGFVSERLGQPLKSLEQLISKATFDPKRREGSVVVLLSYIKENNLKKALAIMKEVTDFSFSPYVKMSVKNGVACVATLYSATFDALLLRAGVPSKLRYCGILQFSGGGCESSRKRCEIIDAIFYEKTTLDPARVFIKRKMTSVCEVASINKGRILVSCREVPVAAKRCVRSVFENIRSAGMSNLFFERKTTGGVLHVLIPDGANTLAAVEECGIETFGVRYGLLMFEELEDIHEVI